MTDIRKKYFRNLLQNHDNSILKQVLIDLIDCKNKVVRDIRAGRFEVNQQKIDLDQIINNNQKYEQGEQQMKSKRLLMQKQIQSLKRQQFQNDQAFKKAKQQIIMQRQQQIRQQKQARQRKKRQIQQKTKKWSQQHKQLLKKKEMKLAEQQKLRQQQQLQNKLKLQKQKQLAIEQKRKQIQLNLKNLQQNRSKRQQMMKVMRSQSLDRIPLHIQFEKKAKQLEYQKQFQESIQKKNHKLAMKMDFEAIKSHERMFLTKIQQRNKKFQQLRSRASSSIPQSQFNIYTNRSQEKMKQQLEKKNRRWKYQQKIKQIPIQIDQSKKVKVQIALDRAKNPFKYNFLSQKSLNEFQIYGQFKNFSITTNPKQIGNNYLQQLKKAPKQSRVQKSNSIQLTKQSSISQRPQYRNYLAQLKSKRPEIKEQQPDQFKRIIKTYKSKDKAYKQLQKKSEQLENNLNNKMKELKTLNSPKIENILKKQSEIDQVYSKALKARLACLQISS